jgi:hypothetical protein
MACCHLGILLKGNFCFDGRLVFVWTKSHLLGLPLSEVYSTSDTILLFWLSLVRSLLDFGHHLAFLAFSCPKFTRLRTSPCFIGFLLSEVYSTSDTILLYWLSLVRSLLSFGHRLAFLAFPCPKFTRLLIE